MRILMLLATVALVSGVLARLRSPEDPWADVSVDSLLMLPEVTDLEAVRIQQELLPLMERSTEGTDPRLRQEYAAALERLFTPEQLRKASAIPSDREGQERYLRELVLATPGLTTPQRETLERLGRAFQRLPEEQRSGAGEGRYWQMVALLLTPEQMRELRARLPGRRRPWTGPGEVLQLPGLAEAQAHRVASLARSFEADTAADRSHAQQLEAELARSESADRLLRQQELLGIQVRLLERRNQLQKDLLALLQPEQRLALEAIPPAGPGDFRDLVERLVSGVGWEPEQRRRLEPQLRRLQEQARRLEPEVRALREHAEDPDGVALREKTAPLERQRLAVAREFASLMTDSQLQAFLATGAEP